jgi:hypothetical protein
MRIYYLVELPGQKFADFHLFTKHYPVCFKKNPFALNPAYMKNHEAKIFFQTTMFMSYGQSKIIRFSFLWI